MSAHSTETSSGENADSQSKVNQALSTIRKRGQDGSVAMLVGGAMLAWALTIRRKSKGQTTLLALTCLAVLGIGMRQRRTKQTEEDQWDEEDKKKISDEAHAEAKQDLGAQRDADESQSVYQSETEPNPRGMSDRSDIQTDDGGDIDFVEGKDPDIHRETHLEDDNVHDPRLHPESDDERTEVDLSEAAMADEASEAAGPHPEQAYPAREGTDPEPTSDKAPERVGEGAVAPAGSKSKDRHAGDETQEGDDGSEETTDEPEPTEEEQESFDNVTEAESENSNDDT